MLDSLRELLDSDVNDDIGFTIDSASHSGSDLLIRIRVRSRSEPHDIRSTALLCRRPRSFRLLAATWLDGLAVLDSHVLLWPHCQPRVALFCRGSPVAPNAVVGALLDSHYRLAGDWIPFKAYINMAICPLFECSGTEFSGVIADGPQELVAGYKSALESNRLECSLVPSREPQWWDDGKWIPESGHLHVMVIGESYVVAPHFAEVQAEPSEGAESR